MKKRTRVNDSRVAAPAPLAAPRGCIVSVALNQPIRPDRELRVNIMTSVELLITEIGRLTTQVGRIDFYALPVRTEDDFAAVPRNIVSLAEAQAVSLELSRGSIQGKVGRYDWRKSS